MRTYTHAMFRVSGLSVRAATCAVLAVFALAACGESGDETAEEAPAPESSSDSPPTGEPAPPGTPDCTEVWQEGASIPRSYQGCAEQSGGYVERDVLGCSSGQRMVRFADRYYGVLGGTVSEAARGLDEDRDYREAVRSCTA